MREVKDMTNIVIIGDHGAGKTHYLLSLAISYSGQEEVGKFRGEAIMKINIRAQDLNLFPIGWFRKKNDRISANFTVSNFNSIIQKINKREKVTQETQNIDGMIDNLKDNYLEHTGASDYIECHITVSVPGTDDVKISTIDMRGAIMATYLKNFIGTEPDTSFIDELIRDLNARYKNPKTSQGDKNNLPDEIKRLRDYEPIRNLVLKNTTKFHKKFMDASGYIFLFDPLQSGYQIQMLANIFTYLKKYSKPIVLLITKNDRSQLQLPYGGLYAFECIRAKAEQILLDASSSKTKILTPADCFSIYAFKSDENNPTKPYWTPDEKLENQDIILPIARLIQKLDDRRQY